MKVFVPFTEALVDELLSTGVVLVPFQLGFQRCDTRWEALESRQTLPVNSATAATPTPEPTLE